MNMDIEVGNGFHLSIYWDINWNINIPTDENLDREIHFYLALYGDPYRDVDLHPTFDLNFNNLFDLDFPLHFYFNCFHHGASNFVGYIYRYWPWYVHGKWRVYREGPIDADRYRIVHRERTVHRNWAVHRDWAVHKDWAVHRNGYGMIER